MLAIPADKMLVIRYSRQASIIVQSLLSNATFSVHKRPSIKHDRHAHYACRDINNSAEYLPIYLISEKRLNVQEIT